MWCESSLFILLFVAGSLVSNCTPDLLANKLLFLTHLASCRALEVTHTLYFVELCIGFGDLSLYHLLASTLLIELFSTALKLKNLKLEVVDCLNSSHLVLFQKSI